jgi:hypothetical protein
MKKKEFIYWWVCPSGNQYYIHGDTVTEARLIAAGSDEVDTVDFYFIDTRAPQGKWCRSCCHDKQWPPYLNSFLKITKET